jgi:hypothetical protein
MLVGSNDGLIASNVQFILVNVELMRFISTVPRSKFTFTSYKFSYSIANVDAQKFTSKSKSIIIILDILFRYSDYSNHSSFKKRSKYFEVTQIHHNTQAPTMQVMKFRWTAQIHIGL